MTNRLKANGEQVLQTGLDQAGRSIFGGLTADGRFVYLPTGGVAAPTYYDVLAELDGTGAFHYLTEDWRTGMNPSVILTRGKEHAVPLAPPAAAKMTFVLNNQSGAYSPSQSALIYGRRTRFQIGTPGDPGQAETAMLGAYVDDLKHNPAIGVQEVQVTCLGILSKFVNAEKQYSPLYSAITTDVALGYICDAIGIDVSLRVFDTGNTTLDYWWLNGEDPWEAALALVHTEGPGATLYEDTLGRLVFKKRRSRVTDTASATSQGTFVGRRIGSNPIWKAFEFNDGKKLAGNYCAYTTKKRTAKTATAVWNYGATLTLTANEVRPLTITASDPFTAAVAPVVTTDYVVSAGSIVSITLSRTSGQTTVLTITAGAGGATVTGPVGVAGIQVRAQPVSVDATTEIASQIDVTASIDRYGKQTIPIKPRAEVAPETAQILVDDYVRWYTHGRPTISIVLSSAYGDVTTRAQQVLRDLGDRVTIINEQLPLSSECWIEGIRHRILKGGILESTFICEQSLEGLGFGPWYFTSLVDNAAAGTLAWTNPAAGELADDIYTVAGPGVGDTHYLDGLLAAEGRVPSDATVTGVKYTVKRRARRLDTGQTAGAAYASVGGDPQAATAWTSPGNAATEDAAVASANTQGTGYHVSLGPLTPAAGSTASDDTGQVAWSSPTNALVEDAASAVATLYGSAFGSSPQNPPGTAANNQSSIGWTGSGNVYADDANYATATIGGMTHTTDWLEATGFGFSLPSVATVTGIKVEIYGRQVDAAHRGKLFVALVNGGGNSENKSVAISDSLVTTTYGSSSDLWNTTWTPAQVNSGSFKVRAWFEQDNVESNDVAIGSIKVTVYWNRASGPDGPRAPASAATVNDHGTQDWTSPSNILAEDGSVSSITLTTASPTVFSDTLQANTFGFSLPSTAIIQGIQMDIKARRTTTNPLFTTPTMGVFKSGVSMVSVSNPSLSGTLAWYTLGGPSDLLGTTWTAAEVNSSGFGGGFYAFAFSSTTVTYDVDQIRMTVTYKVDGQASGPTYTTSATTTNSTPVWTNPDKGRVANSDPATSALGGAAIESDFLDLTNLGFSIPTDATIKGIQVYTSATQSAWNADSSLSHAGKMNLVLLTGNANTQKQYTPTNAYGYVGVGSASDLWGTTWTAAAINSSSFGVRLWLHQTDNATNNLQLDGILVQVTYNFNGRQHTQKLRAINAGFTVPYGSVVEGVTVDVKANRDVAIAETGHVQLRLCGASIGSSKTMSTLAVGSPAWQTLGSATDKWGVNTAQLTQGAVNNTEFGVEVWFDHSDPVAGALAIGVDAIRITVAYRPALGSQTEWLTITDFGFSIPTDAVIAGIAVDVKARHSAGTATGAPVISICRDGIGREDPLPAAMPGTTLAWQRTGSEAELWNASWTAADINADGFGVALFYKNTQADNPSDVYAVDAVRVTVYYVPKVTDKTVRLFVGGSITGSDKATAEVWPAIAATASYGSPIDLWGTGGLTPAQVNAADFGARLQAEVEDAGYAEIDEAAMFIYYTTPS